MLVCHRVTSSITFASTSLSTRVERDTVRIKSLAQEHHNDNVPSQGSNLDAQSGDEHLTMRSPHLPQITDNSLHFIIVPRTFFLAIVHSLYATKTE